MLFIYHIFFNSRTSKKNVLFKGLFTRVSVQNDFKFFSSCCLLQVVRKTNLLKNMMIKKWMPIAWIAPGLGS